ncbi:MAG: hypothetical protein WAM91_01605 [Candidatus Acidiferrales bacterium]
MGKVRVECYSGYRADERPLRFTLGTQSLEIISVDDQWHSPDATFFRVCASDGNSYVLRHSLEQDVWTLEGYRAGAPRTD